MQQTRVQILCETMQVPEIVEDQQMASSMEGIEEIPTVDEPPSADQLVEIAHNRITVLTQSFRVPVVL